MALRIQIANFKIRQYLLRANCQFAKFNVRQTFLLYGILLYTLVALHRVVRMLKCTTTTDHFSGKFIIYEHVECE